MAKIEMKNASGKKASSVEVADAVFAITPNIPVMHQVVVAQLAHRRSGTQSTKTRAEVIGGGKKPYKQKGTGNARQGSIRAPHFSGGAVSLGPTPRKYSQRTPKKMVQLAMRSALSDRMTENKIVVVDEFSFAEPSTKSASAVLKSLGVSERVLLVLERKDATSWKSFRNLRDVQVISTGELNAYDILCNDWIVFTKASLPTLEGAK
ncbi:MAG: 50S ribosomal protein L4 [Actinomycetota bacterium]